MGQRLCLKVFVLESEVYGGYEVVDHLGTAEQPRSVYEDGHVGTAVPQRRHGPTIGWRQLDIPRRGIHQAPASVDRVADHEVRVSEPGGSATGPTWPTAA